MLFATFFTIAVVGATTTAAPADHCFTPADSDGSYQVCVGSSGGVSVKENNGTVMPAMVKNVHEDVDLFYLIFSASLVFFMQAGFSMLEAGSVKEKNVQNILYKNLMDACMGAIAFWLIGYALAFGNDDDGPFIGSGNFGLSEFTNEKGSFGFFFFQWAFAATAATIVSGSVAERCDLRAYFCYSIFLTMFVYPVVVHWIWDAEGWLCAWGSYKPFTGDASKSNGLIDFAGSGVVHMTGGFSGLWGAIMLGPRLGRFEEGGEEKYKPHNILIASLGVAILWFGWYGFNAGSTLMVSGGMSKVAAKAAVTTTIAAASGAVTCTLYGRIVYKRWELMLSLNGVLAGLVSITANCPVVELWGAMLIGIIGACVYMGASQLLKKLKIDDPLDAFPVHGACGVWGVLAAGIFGTDENIAWAYGNDTGAVASGEQFGVQLTACVCIIAWVSVTIAPLFFLLKKMDMLRVDQQDEFVGLDVSEHGGSVYQHGSSANLLGGTGGRRDSKTKEKPEAAVEMGAKQPIVEDNGAESAV